MKTENIPAEFQNQVNKIIGKKVLIVNKKHPWKDHTGEIVRFETTLSGPGFVIKLKNGVECFIFNGSEIRYL